MTFLFVAHQLGHKVNVITEVVAAGSVGHAYRYPEQPTWSTGWRTPSRTAWAVLGAVLCLR